MNLQDLARKKVVVDVSIYLYKYKSLDLLLPNMSQFIHTFLSLGITPIFVFDGKPKQNKQKTLEERQVRKNIAWEQYNELIKDKPPESLQYLKNQFTKISQSDIAQVKKIMDSLRVVYIDAPNEADEICASLMLTKQVHACISDDMDMLVHGCKYVIRDVNISEQSAVMYNLNNILKSLHLDYHTFKQLCVLSGTDYYSSEYTLFKSLQLLKQYNHSTHTDFYEWLVSMGLIQNIEYLKSVYDMFDVSHVTLKLKEQPQPFGNAGSCIAAS